ncbi:cyclic nucleotide-binding domain-containing protein [Oscillatoria sp. CS-180]|uniref:cyclic nucleotide-binding domain-containing protein n=1 Tax=Oscillatoria sp. CS-180 TaxID=3021720 RepID=UPI00232E7BC8|nr:cyclic nucleotide-binding domain-containing protein [Oscillatoria sp. CS-180]MDB9525181.1 cyclic nucleotide-binding domain-containing protein [Oscillatoria sp. CS-180]
MDALLQGFLGASSLVIGAVLGICWKPDRVVTAAIMAFGSGTLLAAIAFDITQPVFAMTGFWPILIGFVLGGALFTIIINYIDDQGGFIRHPSSSRRFFYHHRQEETSEVLDEIAHVEMLHSLSPSEVQAIIPLLKPLSAEPGTMICQEGMPGDAMFIIVDGEADIYKGPQLMAKLGAGEMFGEMSLLTGEERSASVVARTPMRLYELDKVNFDGMLTRSPHLASGLSRILARRLRETTQSTANAREKEKSDGQWRKEVLDSVEVDFPLSELQIKQLAKSSAPLAILVGTLMDNIPEALVIGFNAGGGHLSGSFLMAVFISNIPEALSSSVGMQQAGTSAKRILALWGGAVLLSGLTAMLGSFLSNFANDWVLGTAQSLAGGAILAMLSSTMMPEAYELGGGTVTYSTIAGFLVGFWVVTLSLVG